MFYRFHERVVLSLFSSDWDIIIMTKFFVDILYLVIITTFVTHTLAIEYEYNGGHRMPYLGLGSFAVTDEKELTDALNKALEIGYRHIDTAAVYRNEQIIGKVLKEWISSGKLKRDDIFITTKLGSEDIYPDKVKAALRLSLEKLQLDYVDLYLIHKPIAKKIVEGKRISQPTDLISVWKKMEEQVDAGRTKTIGVSNFNISQIERIQRIARIQPANIQVEAHVYFQQRELRDFAKRNNITVIAYSPLGAPGRFKKLTGNSVRVNDILNDSVIKTIADKHNKSTAQVALRFLVQSGWVVIPKSTNPKRLKENYDIFDFTLDEGDMTSLHELDKGKAGRIMKMTNDKGHPEFPF